MNGKNPQILHTVSPLLFFTSSAHMILEHNPVENNTVYGRPITDKISFNRVVFYYHMSTRYKKE